jgi:hypothetical protein
MSNSKKGYDTFKGLLGGNQVNTLDSGTVLSCVQEKTLSDLGDATRICVLHDPCDIRKPNSKEMEHIGKVLSLKKQVVNGYRTFNSVAVDIDKQGVNLLSHELYSTEMPNYVGQKQLLDLSQLSVKKQDLVASGEHINTTVLYKKQLLQSSLLLKKEHPNRLVCHISDREFDNEQYFAYINDELEDEFITRVKLSRLSNQSKVCYTPTGKISKKKSFTKLIDKSFSNTGEYLIDRLSIKGKLYKNASCVVEWEPIYLEGKPYNAIRITLKKEGKSIFEHSMLLITNRKINTLDQAKEAYQAYILRFKIEVVFRFLKQNLGWESFQVRDFNSIKNLLAIAFFLVGYFQELEVELKMHPLANLLCQLASSKGKITIFYLLEGLCKIVSFQEVDLWMKENNISREELDQMVEYIKSQQKVA